MNHLKLSFGIALVSTLLSTTVKAGASGGMRILCEEHLSVFIGNCYESIYHPKNSGHYTASVSRCFLDSDGFWAYTSSDYTCQNGEVYPSEAWDVILRRHQRGDVTSYAFMLENPGSVNYNYGNKPAIKYTDFSKMPDQFKKRTSTAK